MRYLVEFTGDHPTLPLEELKAAAEAVGEGFTLLELRGMLAVIESEELTQTIKRCALLRSVSIFCTDGILDNISMGGEGSGIRGVGGEGVGSGASEIEEKIRMHFPNAVSFRVTPRKHLDKFPEVDIQKLIGMVASAVSLPVSLRDPDVEILVFLTPENTSTLTSHPGRSSSSPPHLHPHPHNPLPPPGRPPPSPRYYIGLKSYENQRTLLHERAVRYRPFFSPISLPPVLARMLINLSRVPPGGTLLDPFCGTGGILLESSLLGLHTVGADLDRSMLEGAERNLDHFGISAELVQSDIGNMRQALAERGIARVDAIATDMPYGRASTTFGEELGELTRRMLDSFDEILGPGRYAALVSSRDAAARLRHRSLRLVSCHRIKVHRSLDRYFIVYRKDG